MARAARPDCAPDTPLPLDDVATWLAVPAADPETVVRALRMRTVLPGNWRSGLDNARKEGAFATPSVGGYVLVVGTDLAVRTSDPAELEQLLPRLSDEFGSAFWFRTDERLDVHGWAFAERGQLRRGYAYSEEHGHTWWFGDVTEAERELGCFVDDPRDRSDDEIKWWPDARTVRALATAWTVDPRALAALPSRGGGGFVGRL